MREYSVYSVELKRKVIQQSVSYVLNSVNNNKKLTGDAWRKDQKHRVKGCFSVFSTFLQ